MQGLCSLRYDVNVGGFYENVNGTRYYAHEEPIIVEPKEKHPKTKDINPDERIEPSNELDDLPF